MAGIIILCIQSPPAPCPRLGSITAWLGTAPINLFTRYSARVATVAHVARDQLRMALPLPVLPPPPAATSRERGPCEHRKKQFGVLGIFGNTNAMLIYIKKIYTFIYINNSLLFVLYQQSIVSYRTYFISSRIREGDDRDGKKTWICIKGRQSDLVIDFWLANPGRLVSRACNGAESGSVHIIRYTAK